MTEPLPCPFCGHVGLSQYEGSTFRWLATECNGCGAQCGEERINTMTMERSAAIEQAKVAAIETWNTRAAQPEQQAEPVACRFCFSEKGCWAWQCYNCGEIDAVQKPAPPQQQAEPKYMVQSNGRHSPLLTHMMNKPTTPPQENT